jgi:hypothetical protein
MSAEQINKVRSVDSSLTRRAPATVTSTDADDKDHGESPDAIADSKGYVRTRARFASVCDICADEIYESDLIYWRKREIGGRKASVRHSSCHINSEG